MNFNLSGVQETAVTSTDGPILVFAGAGSGKTRVITYRIAYLLSQKKVAPENILAVTFTNKAAKEMKARVTSIINDEAVSRRLTISTFHSLGLQILKKEHKSINYPRDFVIYSEYEQTELMKRVMEEGNISKERFSARTLLSAISAFKNDRSLINSEKYLLYSEKNRMAKRLFNTYNNALRIAGAMDFDDLILKVVELFEKDDEIRKKYAGSFKYIMVDEYQDTNHIQYLMVKYLSSVHGNICVVGDDDQSIYSWRGAQVENILNFHVDFEGCKTVKLEQNYRSNEEIVDAAGRLIAFNRKRAPKNVFTDIKPAESDGIEVSFRVDEIDEAEYISSKIIEQNIKGRQYSDFAVIIRTNSQTRPFEISFSKHKIPYKVIGGMKFFENKEIKDLVAYLRILVNPNDEVSLRRVINFPSRGIGQASLEKLYEISSTEKTSTIEVLNSLEKYAHFSPAQKTSLMKFRTIYDNLKETMRELKPVDFANYLVAKIELEQQVVKFAENDVVARIKLENIKEFINAVSYYSNESRAETTQGFFIDLINSITLIQSADDETKKNCVSIITAHSAKGLEFDTVFLIGFYMGGLPCRMALEEGTIEEERRLCYVAFTRARRKLFITVPSIVRNRGRIEPVKKSVFLEESGLTGEKYSGIPKFGNISDFLSKLNERIDD